MGFIRKKRFHPRIKIASLETPLFTDMGEMHSKTILAVKPAIIHAERDC